jgi:hypothetical protein
MRRSAQSDEIDSNPECLCTFVQVSIALNISQSTPLLPSGSQSVANDDLTLHKDFRRFIRDVVDRQFNIALEWLQMIIVTVPEPTGLSGTWAKT